jgi:hypothetical protein
LDTDSGIPTNHFSVGGDMTKDTSYRDQFDRFAQDSYLKMLLKTAPDDIIPTLFMDLMNRVNMVEGKAGLILVEVERAQLGMDSDVIQANTVKVLEGAVDMSNILKALMEYHEMVHQDKQDDDGDSDDDSKQNDE